MKPKQMKFVWGVHNNKEIICKIHGFHYVGSDNKWKLRKKE